MSAHHLTPSAFTAARRFPRRAVLGIALALLIATAAYGAARIIGPGSGSEISPSGQATRELHQTVVGLYGPQSARRPTVSRDQVRRELRETTIALYGSGR
jgi:hypothetical protein